MSFSSDTKEELSRIGELERHCMVSELSAIISLCGKVTMEGQDCSIVLHTENVAVARRFYSLIRNIFDFQPLVSATRHNYLKKNRYYMISVRDRTMTLKILKTLALIYNLGRFQEDRSYRDNPVIQRTCCQRAYLRGAFLSAGSVTDPEKNYHFEIACQNVDLADLIRDSARLPQSPVPVSDAPTVSPAAARRREERNGTGGRPSGGLPCLGKAFLPP